MLNPPFFNPLMIIQAVSMAFWLFCNWNSVEQDDNMCLISELMFTLTITDQVHGRRAVEYKGWHGPFSYSSSSWVRPHGRGLWRVMVTLRNYAETRTARSCPWPCCNPDAVSLCCWGNYFRLYSGLSVVHEEQGLPRWAMVSVSFGSHGTNQALLSGSGINAKQTLHIFIYFSICQWPGWSWPLQQVSSHQKLAHCRIFSVAFQAYSKHCQEISSVSFFSCWKLQGGNVHLGDEETSSARWRQFLPLTFVIHSFD